MMSLGRVEQVTREIPLPCGRVAIVPASEYERLMCNRWYYNKDKLRVRSERTKDRGALILHREVLRAPDDMHVEAIDGSYLNCAFDNLRLGRPKPKLWTEREKHLIKDMRAVGRTYVEIAQELGNGRTAVGVRTALKRWKNEKGKVMGSREAWKRNSGTYRNGPRGKAMQECFSHPLVHVDVVTGEILAWRWTQWQESDPAPQPATSVGLG